MSKFDDDSLGSRMKDYESITKTRVVPRMPFIIRLDGKAFHTFTRGLEKPFDNILVKTMQATMLSLCEDLSNCVFGYTQSDEITLIFRVADPIKTQGLFDYEIQKLVSVSASKCTRYFNEYFYKFVEEYNSCLDNVSVTEENKKYYKTLTNKLFKAEFDARIFNVPDYEIINNLIWRQQDAVRNSIQSLGQANFSHTQLDKKNMAQVQDMLMLEKNINWNNLPTWLKRGSCAIKVSTPIQRPEGSVKNRLKWELCIDTPIFTSPEGRKWLEKFTDIQDPDMEANNE